jgi:hypothetical protein
MKNNEIVSENKTDIRNLLLREGPEVKEIFLTTKGVRMNSDRVNPEDISSEFI